MLKVVWISMLVIIIWLIPIPLDQADDHMAEEEGDYQYYFSITSLHNAFIPSAVISFAAADMFSNKRMKPVSES
jgi:hypothetical protein